VVEAETAEEAATAAHEVIAAEDENLDPDYTSSMFVLPFEPTDFVAMRRGVAFTRAADEWQCCAGPIEFTGDGHSGYCPNRQENK
jgi:hypothetical protein